MSLFEPYAARAGDDLNEIASHLERIAALLEEISDSVGGLRSWEDDMDRLTRTIARAADVTPIQKKRRDPDA